VTISRKETDMNKLHTNFNINFFPSALMAIVALLQDAGASVMLVGGAVVDLLQRKVPVDWDLEVYGKTYEELGELLAQYEPNQVGKKFGILKLSRKKTDGVDIDVSVPRRENNIGTGHKDFEIFLDPNMSSKDAAMRRDVTFNALYYDLQTREIVDHFGGLADLEAGIVRLTDSETFLEDSIRPMRVMQLLARKGQVITVQTAEACRIMGPKSVHDTENQRVGDEFRKLLMKAEKPSVGLKFLQRTGLLAAFPELNAMVGDLENPEWHPEGDAWEHTLEVVDNAAWVRDQGVLHEDWVEAFMWAALLHDVGKPSVRDPKTLSAHGHDSAGGPIARAFLDRYIGSTKVKDKAEALISNHMQPGQLHRTEARASRWEVLKKRVRLSEAGWLSRCDFAAKPSVDISSIEEHGPSKLAFEYHNKLDKADPILTGGDLIAAGIKPGPGLGKGLKAAYEAQLDGTDDKDQLLGLAVWAAQH
jgi:tRNA nucleotidyltransferase (CCA-adding enzyme)